MAAKKPTLKKPKPVMPPTSTQVLAVKKPFFKNPKKK